MTHSHQIMTHKHDRTLFLVLHCFKNSSEGKSCARKRARRLVVKWKEFWVEVWGTDIGHGLSGNHKTWYILLVELRSPSAEPVR